MIIKGDDKGEKSGNVFDTCKEADSHSTTRVRVFFQYPYFCINGFYNFFKNNPKVYVEIFYKFWKFLEIFGVLQKLYFVNFTSFWKTLKRTTDEARTKFNKSSHPRLAKSFNRHVMQTTDEAQILAEKFTRLEYTWVFCNSTSGNNL